MSGVPTPFIAPDLVNASVSVVFELVPELASKPIEEIHAKSEVVARFLACPSCSGSGKLVFREGIVAIRVTACPVCGGKGTIHAAVAEMRNQVLLLDTHAAAQKNRLQAAIQRLTEINYGASPEVQAIALEIAGILAGTIPPSTNSATPTQSNEQPISTSD